MAIKAFRIGGEAAQPVGRPEAQANPSTLTNSSQVQHSALNNASAASTINVLTHSDAVQSAVRSGSSKSATGAGRIGDYKEAKEISKEIAEAIKGDERSADVHSDVNRVSAKEHLLN